MTRARGPSGVGDEFLRELAEGGVVAPARLTDLAPTQRAATLEQLLSDAVGRRWLRGLPNLDAQLAARLLAHEADFRLARRDHTLDILVRAAPLDALMA